MIRRTLLLLLITTFIYTSSSQCTSAPINIDYLITGNMELGSPLQGSAKSDYSVVFSSNQVLGLSSQIFFAFAITGLTTSSGQNYYSVSVDRVFFTNDNRVMQVYMDYMDVSKTIKTQWSKIKLSYIVVSPQFEGVSTGGYIGNSYLWASSLEVTPPLSNAAGDTNGLFSHSNSAGMCGYIGSVPPIYGTNCPSSLRSIILYHYYVMGFKYNSTGDNTYEFRASILGGTGSNTNQNDFNVVIGPGVVPNGPKFTIDSYSGRLQKIKIGIVLTVLTDYDTYPVQSANIQSFKYSGVFMPVSTFNTNVGIINSTSYNRNHFDLAYVKYKIFGFSRLSLEPNNFPVDFSLDVKDTYSLSLSSLNSLSDVLVSADFYSKDIITGSCLSSLTQRTQVKSQQYTSVPGQASGVQTMVKIASSNGILTDASNQYVFDINAYDIGTDSSLITLTIQLTYQNLKAGYSYILQTAFNQLATTLPNGWSFQYTISVDGSLIFTDTITTDANENDKINKMGRSITSTSSVITLTLLFTRSPTQDIRFHFNFALLQVSNVFDPINLCCSNKCPLGTALSLRSNPYVCVKCSQFDGQIYNTNTNQCDCLPGYYLFSASNQICRACTGSLCATCSASSPGACLTCVAGAQQILPGYCTCKSGLNPVNGKCQGTSSGACDYKCAVCSAGTCNTCNDPIRRNINNQCKCIDGYFDNLSANCVACNSNCKTCLSLTQCTSCFEDQNKRLVGNQCVCNKGYYLGSDSTGNLKCLKCQAQCDQCSGNAWSCSFCDPIKNKKQGLNSRGQLTCICQAGYLLDSVSGSCIKSDCSNDPNCGQCSLSGSTNVCVFCKLNSNRRLDTSTYRCVCQQGYYENSSGVCVSCPKACGSCSSSTLCTSCVAGALKSGDLCRCNEGTYFIQNPTRYCKACQQNCQVCDQAGNCTICAPNYTKVNDGRCLCGLGMVINQDGVCSACSSQCLTCKQITKCTSCKSNLLLEEGKCVNRCSIAYYKLDLECFKCPSGCALCSSANSCSICQNGYSIFQGSCFENCPSGSVIEASTSKCVACNYPCRTCTQHPSKCTSCQSDAGALIDNTCSLICPTGSYASEGLCKTCDFSCASCLGSARLCTSCPTGKFLFNGACYDYCPQFNSNGQCVTTCPPGFYQSSNSACTVCPSICQQCKSANQCTVCSSNTFSYLGSCVNECPSGTYSVRKECAQCDVSCKTCSNSPTTCIECSRGYIFSSTQARTCVRESNQSNNNCNSDQFLNLVTRRCEQCSSDCLTCSSATTCLSCKGNSIPVNGRCNLCPLNCQQCLSISECNLCMSGFYLYNKACVSACPYPLNVKGGVCQCSSGILNDGTCVQSCPSGYTAISSKCEKCNSNCKQCSQKVQYCTSCLTGFQLNVGSKTCQKISSVTCPYGQYQQNGKCNRFCSPNLVYLSGLCYYTCISGYINNNQGGCIQQSNQNNQNNQNIQCRSSEFIYNNTCVNVCPDSFYPNLSTRKCDNCPQNCINCASSTTCNVCSSGYRLQNNACVLITNNNNQSPIQCNTGFYYNTTYSVCFPCQSPCQTCSSYSVCLSCINNYALVLGQCVQQFTNCQNGFYKDAASNTCRPCQSPCQRCNSLNSCSSCISGYQLNGQTCSLINNIPSNLVQLSGIQVQRYYRRGNSVIISLLLPAIPSPLTFDQKNRFFTVKQNTNTNTILSINQWQSSLNEKRMFVSVNFADIVGSSFLFLGINSQYMSQAYALIGYSLNDKSYKAVSVYRQLQEAPSTIQIPSDSQTIAYIN